MKNKTEYERFTNLVNDVLKVPHSEIKAKLDAEKAKQKTNLTCVPPISGQVVQLVHR